MKNTEKRISLTLQVAFAGLATHFYAKCNLKQIDSSFVSPIQSPEPKANHYKFIRIFIKKDMYLSEHRTKGPVVC